MRPVIITNFLILTKGTIMTPLGKHTRTGKGAFRRERSDSLVKNLKQDYPELADINGNTKLGTLRKRYDADSLDEVLKSNPQGKRERPPQSPAGQFNSLYVSPQ